MKRWPIVAGAAVALAGAAVAGTFVLAGAGLVPPDETAEVGSPVGAVACLDRVLATMRTIESGGRYNVRPNGGGASGAYQMIDSSWRAWAAEAGVDTTPWPQAWMAPDWVQDRVVATKVRRILATEPVETVPVFWYWPRALTVPEDMDVVPYPEAGNVLTPRQYRERWLAELARRGGCVVPVAAPAPSGDVNVPTPSLAGYQPGTYPLWALVEVQPGRYLAPEVAGPWQAMARAAADVGLTLTITSGYRSLEDQARIISQVGLIGQGGLGAPIGQSPHHLGIAADMDVRTQPEVFAWLQQNAARWCFGNLVQESVKDREPWHWAYYSHVPGSGCTPEP